MSRINSFGSALYDANPNLAQGSTRYAAMMGAARPPAARFASAGVHPDIVRRVAAAYQALPNFDPAARPAFDAMRRETSRQFDFLTGSRRAGGLGVNVEAVGHDPYANPEEMMHDVAHNMRLRVLSTQATGGHPIFSNDENDQFRAVHDAFGHAAIGRGFDRHGEEAAYQSHATMYSPLARRALATETRGQNSTLISTGSFAPQKVALLPAGLSRPGLQVVGRRSGASGLLHPSQFSSALAMP